MVSIKFFGKEIYRYEKRDADSDIKNPQEWLLKSLGITSKTGISVTANNALTLPVYYGALKIIGEDIAKLPIHVYRKNGNKRELIEHPVQKLLYDQPNPLMNSFHWRIVMTIQALSWGNAYSLILRDPYEQPIELRLLKPYEVTPWVYENTLFYKIQGRDQLVPASDMFHIKNIGLNGIEGKGLLTVASEIIGGGIASQEYSNSIYANGGLKKIALVAPGTINENTEKNIQDGWIEKYGRNVSWDHTGKPAVLQAGLNVTEVGLNPAEVALIEQKQFTIEDMARFTRIQQHKLQSLKNATYTNIEHQSTEYVVDTLMPWHVQYETEARQKLFREKEKSDHYIRFNVNALLRGDTTTRANYYAKGITYGWLNPNDVLALEEMNPREDDGGKAYLTPVNMNTDQMVELLIEKMKAELPQK